MITGIDNVGIAVTDLTRSIAFYEKFGFTRGQAAHMRITMKAYVNSFKELMGMVASGC